MITTVCGAHAQISPPPSRMLGMERPTRSCRLEQTVVCLRVERRDR
jgi:hypothetical protein